MPRMRFRLLQLTPRALLPDQGSLLRACSSRFKFSQGRSLSSAARPCLLFPQRVSQRRASNFRPQTGPGQSKHSVRASRKCNFDLPFPNPKSAEITQQPRHGARVGGQPSAPPPLRAPWARQWISPQPIQAGPVPSAPSISQLLLPSLSGRRFFFYRRSRGGCSGTMARRARKWAALRPLPRLCAS